MLVVTSMSLINQEADVRGFFDSLKGLLHMFQKHMNEQRKPKRYCGVVMSGEDAPRPCPEDLIVPEIKTNKQSGCYNTNFFAVCLFVGRRKMKTKLVQQKPFLDNKASQSFAMLPVCLVDMS